MPKEPKKEEKKLTPYENTVQELANIALEVYRLSIRDRELKERIGVLEAVLLATNEVIQPPDDKKQE